MFGVSSRDVPAIKLERTDTTLDLSHMAKEAKEQEGGRGRVGLYTCEQARTDGASRVT
jgi:hypothetical protein